MGHDDLLLSRWGTEAVDPDAKALPSLKARFLLDHVAGAGKVMDIGCGDGKMLRTLARYRPELDLHGCDVRVPDTPADCYSFRQLVDGVPAGDEAVDTVLIFDVLEHVPDPRHTLSEAARILAPGGSLVAFVPVEGERLSFYALFRLLFGRDTYVLTKEHIQSFRHAQLRSLIEENFDVREWRYAYHFLGHLMDAGFFAATRLRALRRFWWRDNVFYNKADHTNLAARVLNACLRLGNAVAYLESRALADVRFGSAGVLLVAEVRAERAR